MNEPLVSIITPTFNHERFIEQCIRSVKAQTYPRWEMIVVDDASDDRTAELVRSLEQRNVTLVSHESRWGIDRLADTYNQALSIARGDRIAILEGDDWWAPERLARQIDLLADPSVVLAYSDYLEVNEGGRVIHRVSTRVCPDRLRTSPSRNLEHFSTLTGLPAASLMFRRDALEAVGGFRSDGMPLVDFPTLVAMALQGHFVRVPAPLYFWRRHPGSVSWANMHRIALGCQSSFDRFVVERSDEIEKLGLDVSSLLRASGVAFKRALNAIPYFDAKCELLCGDTALARHKLAGVALSRSASMRHRLASIVGLAASFSSPRIFDSAARFDRALRSVSG